MIDCTDEQLIEEVRRRGFVIRDAQIWRQNKPDKESSYAGVRVWIGDKEVTYGVSKAAIEHEWIEGLSMQCAADYCLKTLKEKNS